MNKKTYYIVVIAIMLVAVIIRMWGWPYSINDINCDEAMTAINANAIAENGTDIYGTTYPIYIEGWLISGQSAFAIYIVALFIKIFGFSIFAVRLPMLLISITAMIFTLLLMNKLFKNKVLSLCVLALLAINPWHILQSQWTLDCNFFPHIFVIATYFFAVGIKDSKPAFLYISMIIYAITLYTYGIALYLTPVFLVIMAIYLLIKKEINVKKILLCILIFMVIALPIILMAIINFFDLPTIKIGNLTIQNFEYAIRTGDMLIFSENIIDDFIANMKALGEIIFFQYDSFVWNAFPFIGTIYIISLPICIFGIIAMAREKNKEKFALPIVLTWLFLGVVCGIFINETNINRNNILWYPLVILNGIGIYNILKKVQHKKIIATILIALYSISFLSFVCYYKTGTEAIEKSFTWSNGLVHTIQYVEENKTEVILSNEVCKTEKKYVFIKYATHYEETMKTIKQDDILKWYALKDREGMDFSTNTTTYVIVDLNEELTEDVYVVTQQECEHITNINAYDAKNFGGYVVLEKKM